MVGTACGEVMELWHSLSRVDLSRKGSLRLEAKLSVFILFHIIKNVKIELAELF